MNHASLLLALKLSRWIIRYILAYCIQRTSIYIFMLFSVVIKFLTIRVATPHSASHLRARGM